MSTSIPYHPSLVLGNIVPDENLEIIKTISDLQSPIDISLDKMNSMISLKQTTESTIREMVNMSIDPSELQEQLTEIKQEVLSSSTDYMKTRITQEKLIVAEKAKLTGMVGSSIESPVDFTRSMIKNDIPLSFDSIKLDIRYFSFDENNQDAHSTLASIKSFVSASTKFLGNRYSTEVSNAAQQQASSQVEHHQIKGTLIITATCTHKNALLLSPFILNVDKAIRVWNSLYPDKIKVDSLSNMMEIAREEGTASERKMNIISGATCGSSLVGMVHVVRDESTTSSQSMMSAVKSLQTKADVGGWFASVKGGAGLDGSFSRDIKNLLSSQNIDSHVSLITMGTIPTIKSNKLKMGVKEFTKFDAKSMMEQLALMNGNIGSDLKTVSGGADKVRESGQMQSIEANKITNVLSSLGNIDKEENSIMDINSLMSAFEDYVDRIQKGDIGIPINYYLKPITKHN